MSILPPHASALLKAMDMAMQSISDLPVKKVQTLWNPYRCPADWLPWLAWALRASDWNDDWTETQKRQYVASLPYTNRIKGTRAAIETALAAVDCPIQLVEWWERTPKGEPYTFTAEVSVTNQPIDHELKKQIYSIIDNTKNLRSHLLALRFSILSMGHVYVGGASRLTRTVLVKDRLLQTPLQVTGHHCVTLAIATVSEITIEAK